MKGSLARMITGGNIPARKVNILWYHFHCYPRLYLVLGRIRAHPRRITSYEEARSINGIGHRMAEKVLDLSFLSHS